MLNLRPKATDKAIFAKVVSREDMGKAIVSSTLAMTNNFQSANCHQSMIFKAHNRQATKVEADTLGEWLHQRNDEAYRLLEGFKVLYPSWICFGGDNAHEGARYFADTISDKYGDFGHISIMLNDLEEFFVVCFRSEAGARAFAEDHDVVRVD